MTPVRGQGICPDAMQASSSPVRETVVGVAAAAGRAARAVVNVAGQPAVPKAMEQGFWPVRVETVAVSRVIGQAMLLNRTR